MYSGTWINNDILDKFINQPLAPFDEEFQCAKCKKYIFWLECFAKKVKYTIMITNILCFSSLEFSYIWHKSAEIIIQKFYPVQK